MQQNVYKVEVESMIY